MAKKITTPLPADSIDEFWRFVLASHRSVYDPWWVGPECARAWQAWSGTNR